MVAGSSEGQTDARASRPLTFAHVLAFYLVFVFSGWLVTLALRLIGLSALSDPTLETGLYALPLIPVAYKFDPRIFSKAYWKFPSRAWAGIGVIGLMQFIFESGKPLPPLDHYIVFGALFVAPCVEELARAVMITPLMERLGGPAGLVITALLWAWLHDFFWVALAQQVILSLIFVYTRRSLPSAIAAHTVMNVIAAYHIGLHTIIPH
jgi:membrane protease YdiL (CAAX protease family)